MNTHLNVLYKKADHIARYVVRSFRNYYTVHPRHSQKRTWFKKANVYATIFAYKKGALFITIYPDNSSCKHDHHLNTCDE